jgi:hypothetical protein
VSNDKIALLEAALRGLPIADTAPEDGIPLSSAIPGMAREILMLSFNAPASRPPSRKAIEDARKVFEHLPTDALAGFFTPEQIALARTISLFQFAKAAETAKATSAGAPAKAGASAVTEFCGDCYVKLTGEYPTVASGEDRHKVLTPFTAFLTAIFEVVGLKPDSSHSQAKELIERWKGRQPK